jgi:hypothetical protein
MLQKNDVFSKGNAPSSFIHEVLKVHMPMHSYFLLLSHFNLRIRKSSFPSFAVTLILKTDRIPLFFYYLVSNFSLWEATTRLAEQTAGWLSGSGSVIAIQLKKLTLPQVNGIWSKLEESRFTLVISCCMSFIL